MVAQVIGCQPTILALSVPYCLVAVELLSPLRANEQQPAAPKQVESLRKIMVAAHGDRFDFVGGQPAERKGSRYWLATIRPRREGEFVLRHAVKYRKPDRWGLDGRTVTFHLVIGEAGASRVCHLGQFEDLQPYPHARVGDTVVLPVPIDPAADVANWQFEMPEFPSQGDQNWFRITEEIADTDRAVKTRPGDVEVHNGADHVFALVTATAESQANRSSRGPTRHVLTSVFEVVKPGKFNLETRLRWKNGEDQLASLPISVEVVPKDQPLSVMVGRWDVSYSADGFGGGGRVHVPLSRHRLRVGDRVILCCGQHFTPASDRRAAVSHPRVEALKKPFAAPPEPFEQSKSPGR